MRIGSGARDRAWTGDLSLTKEVLYQLSYVGDKNNSYSYYKIK